MRKTISLAAAATLALAASQATAGAERITFPRDYKDTFVYFLTSDRPDNNQVRDLYANLAALESAKDGAPLVHGSQFVMEVYNAVVDDEGEAVLDSEGRMQKADLKVLAVMQKERGWGAAYPEDIRNGDWEYGFFNADGSLKAGVDTRPCMECHLPFAEDDYVIYFEDLHARPTSSRGARRALLGAALAGAALAAPGPALAEKEPVFAPDGIAIRGTDPVAYFREGAPAAGSAEHEHEWMGATWRFSSRGNRDAFAADPEAFAPRYGGYCAWAVSRGYTASTVPEAWRIVDGRLYLNYSKSVQAGWERDVPGNIALADANWPGVLRK